MSKEIKNQYFHFLDVLRFIAIFISFLHHSDIIFFLHGHTFFFVLSGFVLTYQASNEYIRTAGFSWFNFTMRRILRIFPLYFLIVFISYFLIPKITSQHVTLAPIGYYLTLTSNYYSVNHVFILMILWSVAVQEQFYLFISFCYKFFYKFLNQIAFFMILISVAYNIYAEINNIKIYAHTLNHFSSFGIGILAAKLFLSGYSINVKKSINILVLILSGLFLGLTPKFFGFYWSIFDNPLVSIVFSFIILFLCSVEINEKNMVFKFFEKLGQFSYGMYCFQGLVITFGNKIIAEYLGYSNSFLIIIFNFISLIFVAYLSYHLFERKVLDFKKFFR